MSASALSVNDSACTSVPPPMCGRIDGSATSLPTTSRRTAKTEPPRPQSRPSSMNGPRMNQFVAPTSFITSISRRRAKIDRRIVFAIRSVDAVTSSTTATRKTTQITSAIVRTRRAVELPQWTSSTPG